jgi:hypothetical protein
MTRSEIEGTKHEIYWHIFFSCLFAIPYYFFIVLPRFFTFQQAALGLIGIYIFARAIEINGFGDCEYSLAYLKHDFLVGVIYIGFISYTAFIFQDEFNSIRISTLSDMRLGVLFLLFIIVTIYYFENKIHPAPQYYHIYHPKGEETEHYDRHGNYTGSSYRKKKD